MGIILMLALVSLSCGLVSSTSPSIQQTQVALSVQQTEFARQQQEGQSGSGEDESIQQTQVALSVQQTAAAQQTISSQPNQEPTETPIPETKISFDEWMRSANVLLFEDMASDFVAGRLINKVLDGMGIDYTDTADAQGHFKEAILSGAPGGKPWDLIISASENRTGIQGEFFVYLNDSLSDGSSVIIELWNADSFAGGTFSKILTRCGVEFQNDWWDKPTNQQLLYTIDNQNPILHSPNADIRLTSMTGYWTTSLDIGDLLSLTPGSQASLFLGTLSSEKTSNGVAASCLGNSLILQTFSTHSYENSRMIPLWENYIYHSLKARYTELFGE
ncbi:MAG: hypothetical protein OEY93_07895 [Anaerolineae bacterium]|nr:hypothetical protein [Anaerolineae bacterium]